MGETDHVTPMATDNWTVRESALTTAEKERDHYAHALREIRDMDYRGNRHPSAQIAERALAGRS